MREYLLTLVVAAATTYLLVGVVGRVAHGVGAVPEVRDRDIHGEPIPRLGGLAMLGGFLAAMLVASSLPRLQQVFAFSDDARALVTAAVLMCALGAADDRWGLDAAVKLAGQALAAGVLVVQGVQLYYVPLPSGPLILDAATGGLLTVVVVVGTVNAVNFVDGLDGLAAGVVGLGAAAFFCYSYLLSVVEGLSRMATPTLVSAVLTGMCAGFLPHNVNPARIFMGDSGSMLLGLLLAAGSISLTGQFPSEAIPGTTLLPALLPLLLPIAIMAVPFLDLLLAVWRRARAGRSPFAPDKQHLHHRMLALGHSHRRAVLILWVWSALLAFGVVTVSLVGGWWPVLGLALACAAMLAVTVGRPWLVVRRP